MRTLVIARTELLRRVRSRSALVSAFVGPLALAVVISLSFGGGSVSFEIGVADADGSAESRAIASGLSGSRGGVRFERVEAEAAREAVRDGDLDAAIVIPRGYAASQRGLRAQALLVLRDRPVAGQVAEGIARGVAGGVERVRLSVATAVAGGLAAGDDLIAAARGSASPFAVEVRRPEGSELSIPAYFGASMSIMFLFFTIGYAARSLLLDRADGTLARILSTPTSARSVVGGKVLAVAVLGLSGFLTVWFATALLFGADWGPPGAVALLIAATVAAVAGVGLFVSAFARTERRADALTSMVALVFAFLGGNFVSPESMPDLLRDLSLVTPNGWALRAFTDLGTGVAGLADVLDAVVVLLAIGAAFGLVGMARLRRTVLQ